MFKDFEPLYNCHYDVIDGSVVCYWVESTRCCQNCANETGTILATNPSQFMLKVLYFHMTTSPPPLPTHTHKPLLGGGGGASNSIPRAREGEASVVYNVK